MTLLCHLRSLAASPINWAKVSAASRWWLGRPLALLPLPRAGPEPAKHHRAVAPGRRLGDVPGLVPPHVDLEQGRFSVAPGAVVELVEAAS